MQSAKDYYSDPLVSVQNFKHYTVNERGSFVAKAVTTIMKNRFEKDKPFSGGVLVDLGSGPGSSIISLEELGFEKCIAVDSSVPMLMLLSENRGMYVSKIETLRVDLISEKVPCGDSIANMASSCNVLPYLSSTDNLFEEASRILTKGGCFCCSHFLHAKDTDEIIVEEAGNLLSYIHSRRYLRKKFAELGLKITTALEEGDLLKGFHSMIISEKM